MLSSIANYSRLPRQAKYIVPLVRLVIAITTLGLTSCAPKIPDGPVTAPTADAKTISQIPIQRTGCGPVALMNAYQTGSKPWHAAYQRMGRKADASDKQKFENFVKHYGFPISKHTGMARWDKRTGISSLDLADMANDYQFARRFPLPQLSVKSFFLQRKETHQKLLARVHAQLRDSLINGFPPLISVKRFGNRSMGNFKVWKQIHGHFIVLHEIPGKLPADATSFQIKYIDPWGGQIKTGTIKIPDTRFFAIDGTNVKNLKFKKSPTLIVDFPMSSIGSHRLRKGERSVIILASSIQP